MDMMDSIDLLIGAVAIVYGIFLYTGRAQIFKDPKVRKEYDELRLRKYMGVSVVLMGVATFINWKFPSMPMNIGYVVFILLDFVSVGIYMKKFCKLDKKK